jgi:predicted NAD/FAD-binding protein
MTHLDPHRRRVAIVGAGIAGLSAAWLLRDRYAVTLIEAEPRAGGHADTQNISMSGRNVAVDTGFIVYNTQNYPHLTALFRQLDIATHDSAMSFGVSLRGGALEYGGGGLTRLFAQRRNLLCPRFALMLHDIVRFYREAPALVGTDSRESLGDYLARNRYGERFVHDHILPMGAAIWSASIDGMRAFPAGHFARFFVNHGLLRMTNRPQWRTVTGGARRYVARMLQDLPNVELGRAAIALRRTETGVALRREDGGETLFDLAILACHADQALALLDTPAPREAALLGAIRCQDNLAILHSDAALMPKRRAVWSAWNYLSEGVADHARHVTLTYWMNRLQALETPEPLFVTLNPQRPPARARVLRERVYRHPQFDAAALDAQARLPEIQGADRVFFAGAWTGWGFHEDGIASAVRIARRLGVEPPWSAAATERVAA